MGINKKEFRKVNKCSMTKLMHMKHPWSVTLHIIDLDQDSPTMRIICFWRLWSSGGRGL